MGRQKKRTMKKYNRSQRKNNTRRKTHKKRVRKTHKKRTHKRMKGGSLNEGLLSGNHNQTQSTGKKTVTVGQTIMDTAGTVVQSVKDKLSKTGSPTNSGYGMIPYAPPQQAAPQPAPAQGEPAKGEPAAPAQALMLVMSDEELANNPELVNALRLLIGEQLKKTNPELATQFSKSLETRQSEPQKKQLIINYAKVAAPYLFATGLFQPYLLAGALSSLGLTVAAVAVGKFVSFLGSKAGKAAFKAGKAATALFGSTKDKLKLEALTLKIKNCLKTLVDYNIISPTAKEEILKKLRENTGYAKKITRDYDERKNQRNERNAVVQSMKGNQGKGNFSLNVSETPETVVNTAPQQISESESTSTTNDGVGKEGSGSFFSLE